MREHYLLEEGVAFLNHGSFGATPKTVLAELQRWQQEVERQPVDFFVRRAPGLLAQARQPLGEFLGTDARNLSWMSNATTGVNVIARSLHLGPGDEVVLNDHEYGAVLRTFSYLSRLHGFALRIATLPLRPQQPHEVSEAILACVGDKTRLVVASHITSATALLFPIEALAAALRSKGVALLVDGAHAPGHIELSLDKLGVDYYVGNLHKWCAAPKGTAFLYVAPKHQSSLQPLIVSWSYDEPGASWNDLCENWGTRDLCSFLSAPAALEFHRRWHRPRAEVCRAMLQDWLDRMAALLPTSGYRCPLQIASLELPAGFDGEGLHRELWEEERIEVPVLRVGSRCFLRPSVQIYNRKEELERLAGLLSEKFQN